PPPATTTPSARSHQSETIGSTRPPPECSRTGPRHPSGGGRGWHALHPLPAGIDVGRRRDEERGHRQALRRDVPPPPDRPPEPFQFVGRQPQPQRLAELNEHRVHDGATDLHTICPPATHEVPPSSWWSARFRQCTKLPSNCQLLSQSDTVPG